MKHVGKVFDKEELANTIHSHIKEINKSQSRVSSFPEVEANLYIAKSLALVALTKIVEK